MGINIVYTFFILIYNKYFFGYRMKKISICVKEL